MLYALPLFVTVTNNSSICHKLWLRKIPGNRANAEKSKRKVVHKNVGDRVCGVFAVPVSN